MSVSLIKIFCSVLKQNLPRLPLNTGLQARFITAMDIAPSEENVSEPIPNKNFTRFRKRQWEHKQENITHNGESETKKICDPDKPYERIKKKKMAMLLGYCGVDYFGMQRNPGVRTIEEDLLKALLDAKYISEDDFKNQQNAQFQRSSRTDKGVSAARQVVSLKMPLEVNIEEINKRLPDCIKVFGVKRVTNKFNSKSKCNARTYSYTLPTYVFEPSLEAIDDRKQYRIPAKKLEEVNELLGMYKGAKNFHNFTEKKHHTDPSASRFMMSFGVEKVFIDSDMEFAVLLVKGQSFMLHQIRKMVGLMIAVIRGHTDKATFEMALGKEKVMIPTAPGLGLVLDMVHYDRYDARYKTSHDSLTWQEVEDTVQKFKHEKIYPVIVKGELEENAIGSWLEKLSRHSYEPTDDTVNDKNDQKEVDMGGDDDDDDDDDCGNEVGDSEKVIQNCGGEVKDAEAVVEKDKFVAKDSEEVLENVQHVSEGTSLSDSVKTS